MSRSGLSVPGVDCVATLDEAFALVAGEPEMMVIGGAKIFEITMPRMTHIHLTRVHCTIEGDVFMTPIEPAEWREVSRQDHPADARNTYPMTFIELERAGAQAA
jgi:dihydrofolate reductase